MNFPFRNSREGFQRQSSNIRNWQNRSHGTMAGGRVRIYDERSRRAPQGHNRNSGRAAPRPPFRGNNNYARNTNRQATTINRQGNCADNAQGRLNQTQDNAVRDQTAQQGTRRSTIATAMEAEGNPKPAATTRNERTDELPKEPQVEQPAQQENPKPPPVAAAQNPLPHALPPLPPGPHKLPPPPENPRRSMNPQDENEFPWGMGPNHRVQWKSGWRPTNRVIVSQFSTTVQTDAQGNSKTSTSTGSISNNNNNKN